MLLAALGVGGWFGYSYYQKIYANNIAEQWADAEAIPFYIHTGDDLDKVVQRLEEQDVVKDKESFAWVAEQMNLASHVYPGKYELSYPLSNRKLVELLRSGKRVQVKVTITKYREIDKLAGVVAQNIEATKAEVLASFDNKENLKDLNFTPDNHLAFILPDTYFFEWNTDGNTFVKRLVKEYNAFWTEERRQQLAANNLTPEKAVILASIVEEESIRTDERPTIAGLYINRLNRGMKLESDPTAKYAVGRFYHYPRTAQAPAGRAPLQYLLYIRFAARPHLCAFKKCHKCRA